MSINLPRIPLHIQDADVAKAAKRNPSYESFRENQIRPASYEMLDDTRPSTHAMSIIRRFPDGTLDFKWAVGVLMQAIHAMAFEGALLPLQRALLTVVFPEKYRKIEPMQAEILTQFSPSEKQKVKKLVEDALKEEDNYNAGRGGGSVPGRHITYKGTP